MTSSGLFKEPTLASTSRAPLREAATGRPRLMLGVGLGALLILYAGTLNGLVQQWWSYLDYGFALVALVVWVCWRDRAALLSQPVPWWPSALLVVSAAVTWFVGASSGIQVLEQLSFLAVLTGWAVGMLGTGQTRRILRLAGYLSLAMPAWGLLTPVLQQLTVAANSALLAVAGLQADISGTYITIPEGTFEVAGSCAGLSFFMSGLTVSVAYWEVASLTSRGRWLALWLMLLLSLVSNWIRVFLLILIGHWSKMQSPLMGDHGWFGWVIFAAIVVIFLFVTRGIEARFATTPAAWMHSGDNAGRASELVTTPRLQLLPATLVFSGLAAVGPLGLNALERVPREPSPVQVIGIHAGSTWSAGAPRTRRPLANGDSASAQPWAPRYFGADQHFVQSWVRDADTVQVDRLIFSGRGPRHKLFADGNAMARGRDLLLDRAVGIPDGTGVRSMRQAVVRVDSANTRATLYWFRVGNKATGLPLMGRLLQVGSALSRSVPAELIVASIPCGEDCRRAFTTLDDFVVGPANRPSRTSP